MIEPVELTRPDDIAKGEAVYFDPNTNAIVKKPFGNRPTEPNVCTGEPDIPDGFSVRARSNGFMAAWQREVAFAAGLGIDLTEPPSEITDYEAPSITAQVGNIEIHADAHGMGFTCSIDGQPVKRLRSVTLCLELNQPNTVTVEVLANPAHRVKPPAANPVIAAAISYFKHHRPGGIVLPDEDEKRLAKIREALLQAGYEWEELT